MSKGRNPNKETRWTNSVRTNATMVDTRTFGIYEGLLNRTQNLFPLWCKWRISGESTSTRVSPLVVQMEDFVTVHPPSPLGGARLAHSSRVFGESCGLIPRTPPSAKNVPDRLTRRKEQHAEGMAGNPSMYIRNVYIYIYVFNTYIYIYNLYTLVYYLYTPDIAQDSFQRQNISWTLLKEPLGHVWQPVFRRFCCNQIVPPFKGLGGTRSGASRSVPNKSNRTTP